MGRKGNKRASKSRPAFVLDESEFVGRLVVDRSDSASLMPALRTVTPPTSCRTTKTVRFADAPASLLEAERALAAAVLQRAWLRACWACRRRRRRAEAERWAAWFLEQWMMRLRHCSPHPVAGLRLPARGQASSAALVLVDSSASVQNIMNDMPSRGRSSVPRVAGSVSARELEEGFPAVNVQSFKTASASTLQLIPYGVLGAGTYFHDEGCEEDGATSRGPALKRWPDEARAARFAMALGWIYTLPWLKRHATLVRWALEHKPKYDYFAEPTGGVVRCRAESDGPSLWVMARAVDPPGRAPVALLRKLGYFWFPRPSATTWRRRQRWRALWAWESRREGWLRESRRRVREREMAVAADMAVGLY